MFFFHVTHIVKFVENSSVYIKLIVIINEAEACRKTKGVSISHSGGCQTEAHIHTHTHNVAVSVLCTAC